MATYTELQDAIIEMQEQIAGLTKNLSKAKEDLKKLKRWKGSTPEQGDEFYFITGGGGIGSRKLTDVPACRDYLRCHNYFETKEEGEAELDRVITHRRLQKIANRLNGGKEIDWSNRYQVKYSIAACYDETTKEYTLVQSEAFTDVRADAIYCLRCTFLDLAIQDIGEEELKEFVLNRR